jgi:hypothetical protein
MTGRVKPEADHWRRQGQERYLFRVPLIAQIYRPYRVGWDHDHCEFCGRKFSLSDGLKDGYATSDGYHWVCAECFEDFKEEFEWMPSR